MKIFVVIPKMFAGCGFYRQYQPHNRMAKLKDVEVTMGGGVFNIDGSFGVDADIVQFHKGYVDVDGIRACQDRGIVTIGDFDDWWNLDTEHLLYKNYREDNTPEQLIEFMRAVDYVTCTTELLAAEIRKYNPNVVVLQNAMDMDYPGCKVERYKEDKTVFGYAGGSCHGKDIELLRGLNNKLSHYKDYKFRLMGMDGSPVYNHYADVMSDSGRLARTHFDWAEKSNIWDYPKFYNYMDISLVPLVKNKFNSLKSELKLIEAGFFHRAVVVSNVQPYSPLLRHKENAMVVDKPTDWYKHCKYLLDNPQAIKDLGEALYDTVQPFHIDEVNKRRYKFYTYVLIKRNTFRSIGYSRLPAVYA